MVVAWYCQPSLIHVKMLTPHSLTTALSSLSLFLSLFLSLSLSLSVKIAYPFNSHSRARAFHNLHLLA